MVPVKEGVNNSKGDRTKEKNTAHRNIKGRKTAMKQNKGGPQEEKNGNECLLNPRAVNIRYWSKQTVPIFRKVFI